MDRDDAGIFEVARVIRPYLSDLLGPDEAAIVDRELAEILNDKSSVTASAGRILTILGRHRDSEWFLQRVLDDKPFYRPPDLQPAITRGITGPSGDPGVIAADRYECPYSDYVWFRPDIGTSVPRCPNHDVTLTRH